MAKRQYNNDYPSVTQILDVLRKVGLEMWFKYTPIKEINAKSEKGKLIGTQIHEAIHTYIETGKTEVKTEYAEEVTNALKSFMLFRKEHPEIALKNAEMALTSEVHKYNGTLDCAAARDLAPILLDWKTGEAKDKDKPTIYDEYKYQVAAYDYLFQEIKQVKPMADIIVSLAKDKVAYNFYEMTRQETEDYFNEIFLPALKIINCQKKYKGGNGGKISA
jgi:CRISPR/Cas system-associated exonuclease Cas4 (RecB family)